MNIEALAREAGGSPPNQSRNFWEFLPADLDRFAALIRAQAEAETSEHLSMIADELIAGLGKPSRGLAEMIREGITSLESYAASVVWDVRAQALEEAAQHITSTSTDTYGVLLSEHREAADWLRALKDKP